MGAQGATSAIQFGVPSIAALLQVKYRLDLPQVGLVLAALWFGGMCALLAWGAVADRIGSRYLIAIGMLGCAGGLLAAVASLGMPGLLVGFLLVGALGASVHIGVATGVAVRFQASELGLAFGLRQSAVPLGGGLAALTLPALGLTFGVTADFYVLAVLCVVVAVFAVLVSRSIPAPTSDTLRLLHPARDPRLWKLFAGCAPFGAGQVILLGFLALFLHNEQRWSVADAGFALAAVQAFAIVSRLVVGVASDRMQSRASLMMAIGFGAAGLLAGAVLLMALGSAVFVPLMLAGAAVAISWTALPFAIIASIADTRRMGVALAVFNTVLFGASALGPWLFGTLVSTVGWTASWVALPALFLLGALFLRAVVPAERVTAEARAAAQP